MISKDKTNRRKLPSFSSRSTCVPEMTGRNLCLTAMVIMLRVNYIGILAPIQLPGME